ncbi:hypothetical protein [Streptomyces sp. SCSIO ZS0520]|uniref:hypothetical protein n=1 Tax=Streptomyces sp. SCSIO ZS0520 TaxID=2892996 RepID=UPI00398894B5
MGMSAAPMPTMDSLVRLSRARRTTAPPPVRLAVPGSMSTPLGCDAVAVPAVYGRLLLARLPRAGCVYEDGSRWWWIVPSDSDVALKWPAPAHYAAGALVPDAPARPGLIHRPEAEVPYTPPIPLYLALCRLTGTPPAWSRPVSA